MPINAALVSQDYRRKRRLERKLLKDWDALRKKMTRRYTRVLGTQRRVIDPQREFGDELARILRRHYRRVGEQFRIRLGRQLPKSVAPTEAELRTINRALREYFERRAIEQTLLIHKTTARNMDTAIVIARQVTRTGIIVLGSAERTQLDEALDAGRYLNRGLMRRATGIASLETQASAEIAKQTEVEVLTGNTPTVDGGIYSEPDLIKRWWSMGDDLAREDHLQADQQEQMINLPFVVGGAKLMTPGDTSLGAPVEQVINCRCSSEIDPQAVGDIRRERGLGNV